MISSEHIILLKKANLLWESHKNSLCKMFFFSLIKHFPCTPYQAQEPVFKKIPAGNNLYFLCVYTGHGLEVEKANQQNCLHLKGLQNTIHYMVQHILCHLTHFYNCMSRHPALMLITNVRQHVCDCYCLLRWRCQVGAKAKTRGHVLSSTVFLYITCCCSLTFTKAMQEFSM